MVGIFLAVLGCLYIMLGVAGMVAKTDFPDYTVDGLTVVGVGIALIGIGIALIGIGKNRD